MASIMRRLGVVDGLCTSLHVGIDPVEIRGRKVGKVLQPVERNRVIWRSIGECAPVAGHRTLVEVVMRLGTEQESMSTEHGLRGERRALDRPASAE